ncbi:S8 family serine peptidase [Allosphingosinicella deserti]|uniref:Peptidase S8/S53 domain-containing protein n=1 Tax=Allosphingosinicella deserti TaxID=2116704 RepID=A0A2P7QF72_9SPHN|nr:S8 family serine peptidase [Sphingomonas deserti]PSJ36632.1 hypothetical protein C7I55_24885 [Sphingomonas deserti]
MTQEFGSEAHRRLLQRQIDEIRDIDDSRVIEVVVKICSPRNDTMLLSTVAEALRRRGMSSSSRDLLPIERAQLARRGSTKSHQRALKEHDTSLAAQAATAGRAGAAARASSQSNIDGWMARDSVKESIAAVTSLPSRQKPKPVAPRTFWTSSSAVMQVVRDDLEKLTHTPEIEGIYLNQRLHVPPVVMPKAVPTAVEENKVSAWGLRTMGALATWGAFGARGKGVLIGLLDTGVDAQHPDLAGKIEDWAEFDANGNFVPGSKPHDSDKHGTHCAGTIVGGDASGRWIGVAPEAKIAAGLVLNGSQGGTHAQILAGMDWAISRGVDVISMSLGGLLMTPEVPSTYTEAMLTALRAGIPVVTAIGNEGSQTTGAPGNDFLAFSVGATDHLNRAAGFSGGRTQIIRTSAYFPQEALPLVYSKPEISAPGVAIYSSVPGGGWEYLNGTSMATPHVAGAIALLLSSTKIKKSVPADKRAFVIQDLLTGSAEELGESGQNHRFGFGRIDILRSMGYARDLNY